MHIRLKYRRADLSTHLSGATRLKARVAVFQVGSDDEIFMLTFTGTDQTRKILGRFVAAQKLCEHLPVTDHVQRTPAEYYVLVSEDSPDLETSRLSFGYMCVEIYCCDRARTNVIVFVSV